MTVSLPLSSLTGRDTVENVVVFISDSLRFDSLPDAIRARGTTGRAVAASTYTASSVPSMMTGRYPANHRVWGFEDKLPERPRLLTAVDNVAYDINEIWNWPLEMLSFDGVPPTDELQDRFLLPELPRPFLYLFHDKGGHLPYGHEPDAFESSAAFLERYGEPETLRSLYRESVDSSAETFLRLYETLEQRGILDDTLVLFVSDHGELLGEYGGLWGHGSPVVPELVSVPVVFCGAGLPRGESLSTLLSGTDVAPTALSAIGSSPRTSREIDGRDLWRDELEPVNHRCEIWAGNPEDTLGAQYVAASVWDESGGHVFHQKHGRRVVKSVGSLLAGATAPVTRTADPRRLARMLSPYLRPTVTYGEPSLTREEARDVAPATFETGANSDVGFEPDTEELEQLGYV